MPNQTPSSDWDHDGLPFADLLESLVAAARDALKQTRIGTPNKTALWMTPPPVDCGDVVGIALRGVVPIVPGSFPTSASGRTMPRNQSVTFAYDLLLVVRRPCQPVVASGAGAARNPFPKTEDLTASTRDTIYDQRALQQGFICQAEKIVAGYGATDTNPAGMRFRTVWEPFVPKLDGTIGGWDLGFRIEAGVL